MSEYKHIGLKYLLITENNVIKCRCVVVPQGRNDHMSCIEPDLNCAILRSTEYYIVDKGRRIKNKGWWPLRDSVVPCFIDLNYKISTEVW